MTSRSDTVFDSTREQFDIPDGLVYLDGNSLGPLTHASNSRISRVVEREWGAGLIKGWNESGWIDLPFEVGNRIGELIGAERDSVVCCDSTSVNLFKALAAALDLQRTREPHRRTVLTDTGNFPTDVYVAQGLLGDKEGYELRVVEPEAVGEALDETVAALMLTQVDYRTGRLHDMRELTRKAHEVGALAVWDLAHSAGAMPVDLAGCEADFAVGCGYKYLNGGPGAPAFLYVSPRHAETVSPVLAGWMGHEAPFAFDLAYRPAPGIRRMLVGTPPVLAMVSLHAALEVWDGIDLADVRTRSIELSERFVAEVEARCPELTLVSPRDPEQRGSHVSFSFEHGYEAMQALIDRDVIGDFRAPDMMRFGFTPLYLSLEDVVRAAEVLETVIGERLWDDDAYRQRAKVT